MKCVMIFLVLTLVVLMAEPGECLFGRFKAMFQGARRGYKDYRYDRDMGKMARRYGPKWQRPGKGGQVTPPPGENVPEDSPAFLIFQR